MYKPIIDPTSSPFGKKIIDFEVGHVGRISPFNEEFYFVSWFDESDTENPYIKVSEGFYNKNNNKHGPHVYYYSDGNKKMERSYKNGIFHGKEIGYLKNGHIQYVYNYDEGQLHGEIIVMNILTNRVDKKLNYSYGILHGLQEVYTSGICTQTIEYYNGLKHGLESHYNLAGKLMIRFQWKDNKKHGNYNEYYSDSGLRFVCQFWEDVLNGTFIELDKTGKQICRKIYLSGTEIVSTTK